MNTLQDNQFWVLLLVGPFVISAAIVIWLDKAENKKKR
jgi:hypothetical protein